MSENRARFLLRTSLEKQKDEKYPDYYEYDTEWSRGNYHCPLGELHEHDDNDPSLSIEVENKRVFFCHGCGWSGVAQEVEAIFSWVDENGKELYQTLRLYTNGEGKNGKKGKTFLPRHKSPQGIWIYNIEGVRRVLYNLPKVIESEFVFIVEGEKKADILNRVLKDENGIIATTATGGAQVKWLPEYNELFKGKFVIVLPDNDKAGMDQALDVCRNLKPVADPLKLVKLPGLDPKEDVAEWLGKYKHTVKDIVELAGQTPNWEPETDAKLEWDNLPSCNDDIPLMPENEEWVITGLIARENINIWYGPAGVAKSHLIYFLGNAADKGKNVLGMKVWKTPCLYIDLENSKSVRGHLQRMFGKGDMKWIHLNSGIDVPNIDSDKFAAFIEQLPVCCVFIDTTLLLVNQKKFAESKWEVTPVVKVLKNLCAKGYTFVLIFHSLKADPTTIKGPGELLAQADHVVVCYQVIEAGMDDELQLEEDPNQPKTLFLGTSKQLKSRHDKRKFFLQFVPDDKAEDAGFHQLDTPSAGLLIRMRDELNDYIQKLEKDAGRELTVDELPSKTAFIELVNKNLSIGQSKAKLLIDKGVGVYWKLDEVQKGQVVRKHYSPLRR